MALTKKLSRGGAGAGLLALACAMLPALTVKAEAPSRSYADHQLVRVDVTSLIALQAIEDAGGVILNCHPGVGPMDVVLPEARLAALDDLGLTWQVRFNDVAALVARSPVAPLTGDPYFDFFDDYRPYGSATEVGSIVWYMHELAQRYPDLATVIEVGTTYEQRTIWGLRIAGDAGPASRPAVLYFGCQHAREWITTAVPTYFATRLLEGYGSDAAATEAVDAVEFYLIPVVNVDGYLYTWPGGDRLWRKNRRENANGTFGVDLNRNWGEGWGGPGSSSVPQSETFRGPTPFSEPETQVLRDFLADHPHIRAQLDIHSYSQQVLWPYGHTSQLIPDQEEYLQVGTTMQSLIHGVYGIGYQSGPIYSTIYPASGVAVDWAYAAQDVFSFSFECRDQGIHGFELPPEQIVPNAEELYPAMLYLAETDRVRLPVRFDFPAGLPKTLSLGVETPIDVQMIDQYEAALPETSRLHYRDDPTAPFAEAPLVWVSGNTYRAVLAEAGCSASPEFYFSVTGHAGTPATSPRAAPDDVHRAVVSTGNAAFFVEDFSTDPGWQTEALWRWGQPVGAGSHGGDPTHGHTGPNVYGYNIGRLRPATTRLKLPPGTDRRMHLLPAPDPNGQVSRGDYTSDMPARYLTTPPIDCTGRGNVHLAYWRWLGVESNASFDEATVEAGTDGINWTVVWRATQTGAAVRDLEWTLHELDISDIADNQPALRIRWGMGPTDSNVTFPGWNIDDVSLTSVMCQEPDVLPRRTPSRRLPVRGPDPSRTPSAASRKLP